MYNQPSYQVAYANFVMDQHQDIPMTPPNTPPLLGNGSPPTQNNYTQILQAPQQIEAKPFQKPVRSRITFSLLQQAGLESEFKGSAYLYKSRRMEIAERLGLEEKHVKVWFQNRRMKSKKDIIQTGNTVTKPYRSRPIYRHQHSSVKKPTEFSVPAAPMQKIGDSIQKPKMGGDVPLLRKVQEKNAAMHQANNTLPVHKPMAAQLVKGVSLSATKVPKDFKPQLIVQIPVANRPAPPSMQLAMIQPLQPMSQIYPASNPGLVQLQKPANHQNAAQVFYPQIQHQQQSHPLQLLQQSQYYLQQPLPLKPTLSTLISDNSNIPQNPTLTMDNSDLSSQIPSPIEFKTFDFGDITIKSEGFQDQECSEESVDLDKYLNDLERRVEAQKSEKQEAQLKQQQQEQPTTKIPEYNFDLSNCVEQFGSFSNIDKDLTKVSYEGDDFDMKDFIENLDKYVTYPGTAPDLDFDTSPVFNNFAPKLDMPLPMVNLSFEDCLDTSSLFSESMLNF